jgi:hypothetical protein
MWSLQERIHPTTPLESVLKITLERAAKFNVGKVRQHDLAGVLQVHKTRRENELCTSWPGLLSFSAHFGAVRLHILPFAEPAPTRAPPAVRIGHEPAAGSPDRYSIGCNGNLGTKNHSARIFIVDRWRWTQTEIHHEECNG